MFQVEQKRFLNERKAFMELHMLEWPCAALCYALLNINLTKNIVVFAMSSAQRS